MAKSNKAVTVNVILDGKAIQKGKPTEEVVRPPLDLPTGAHSRR